MGIRIPFSIRGVSAVDDMFSRLQHNAQDARPAWDEVADSFQQWMSKQFNSQGSYSGGKWSPLSPKYGKWKATHFPGRKILELTGRLQLSLTTQPFNIDVREPRYAIFGTAVPYAREHQDGGGEVRPWVFHHDNGKVSTFEGGGTLPQRKIIEMPSAIRTQWKKIIQRHLVEGVKGK